MIHLRHHRHVLGRGFTLLELLLFISLASILIGALAGFLSMALQSRVKQETMVRVEQEALAVMEQLTHDLRSATAVASPGAGTSSATLSLTGSPSTEWESTLGQLRRTSGTASPVPLTSSGLQLTNLQFSNVSLPQTKGVIRVQFTLSRLNPSGRNEYDYTQTFYGSATLR